MKRKTNQTVTTAQRANHRYRNVLVTLAATASLISGGSVAYAVGGPGHVGGERIISSRIVSDTVVGDSTIGAGGASNVTATAGGCANGDCSAGAASGSGSASSAGGVYSDGAGFAHGREYGQPDLFYNFYTQGAANQANAQMYISPVPVPPHVGQTFITYQPFSPHEMLYKHHDRFHNYYDGGRGMNRTHVSYSYPPVRTGLSNFYWNVLRIPR